MSYSPILGNPKPQFCDTNGVPLNGGKVYFYEAGTATPLDSYTTSAGSVANANPIILNARGEPAAGIYGPNGTAYKVDLTDSDDVAITGWPIDNIYPGNQGADEWINPLTAIRTSTTTFTVTGDQTADFHAGRRLKGTGGADRYTTVQSSAYTTLTTVTVQDTTDNTGATSTLHASMDTVYLSVQAIDNYAIHPTYYDVLSTETATKVYCLDYEWTNVLRYIPRSYHSTIQDRTNTDALTTYIQAHIDEHDSTYCPSGSYATAELSLPNGYWLHGDGQDQYVTTPAGRGTIFIAASGATGDIFDATGTTTVSTAQAERILIENISLDGNGESINGFTLWNFRHITLRDIYINDVTTALMVGRDAAGDVSYQLSLENIHINGCTNAIDASSSAAKVFMDTKNLSIRACTAIGIKGAFSGTIIGGFWGGNTTPILVELDGAENVTFLGVEVENTGSSTGPVGKDFQIGTTTGCQNINIIGCLLSVSGASYGRTVSIDVVDCDGGVISGNQISEGGADDANFVGIQLGAAADMGIIAGNTFEGLTGSQAEFSINSGSTSFVHYNGQILTRTEIEVGTGLNQVLRTLRNGDAVHRWVLDSDGNIEIGDGSATRDVKIGRVAANVFGCAASGDNLATGGASANVNTPSGGTAYQMPIYNHSGTLLGYIPVYAAAW